MSGSDHPTPGTAPPAKVKKAACGIRYEADELKEGIDFSDAVQLRPDLQNDGAKEEEPQSASSAADEHRQR
ncbi:MAG: hypothetical protein R3276_16195 [Marinobacter sp.]|nr:hypothetical protein [Marinobacter sp.]